MLRKDVLKIKTENPDDYKVLLIAAHAYTENKNSEKPNEILERVLLGIITRILDKYGVKYLNDLVNEV